MGKQTTLHQLSVHYDPEQDRLLLRLKLVDLSEFRFWLTRRFVDLFLPRLTSVLRSGLQGDACQAAAVASFEHEQALSDANFQDAFNAKTSAYPLGEPPILVSQFNITQLSGEVHQLTLLPSEGEGVHLAVDKRIASMLYKLIADTLVHSQWGIKLDLENGVASWPEGEGVSNLKH